MATIGDIKVRIGAVINPLLKDLKKAEFALRGSARKIDRLGSSITNSITLPFAAAAGASLKFAADVETGFSKIENLVGITGQDLERLQQGVSNLSGPLGSFQTELSEGLFVITSASQRGAEALETLEQATKAAKLGLGEVSDISRVGVSVVNAFGKENITAAEAIDQMTAAAREGNFETAQFAPAIGKVLPLANALGIKFSEAAANVAIFTRAGLSAPEAITGLKSLLTSIVKPSEQATKALAKVGLTTDDLRSSVKEQGLLRTLQSLIKLFDGNVSSLAKVIPNVEGLVNVLATAEAQGEDYAKSLEAIENSTGIVDEGFEKLSETANFKFRQALVSLQTAAIELGNQFLPVAKDIIDAVSGVVKWFNDLNPSVKSVLAQTLLYTAALGPLLKGYALLLTSKANLISAYRLLLGAVKGTAGGITILNNALKLSLYGAAAAAIFLVAKAFYDHYESTNAAGKGVRIMSEVTGQLNVQLAEEQAKLAKLFDTLIDDTAAREDKLAVMRTLNRQYPDLLKNIDLEKLSKSQLLGVQGQLNRKLKEEQIIKAKQKAGEKFEQEIIQKQVRIKEVEQGGFTELSGTEQFFRGGLKELGKDAFSLLTGQGRDQEARATVVRDVVKSLENDILALEAQKDKATTVFDELIKETQRSRSIRGIGGSLKEGQTDYEVDVKVNKPEPSVNDYLADQVSETKKNLESEQVEVPIVIRPLTDEEKLQQIVDKQLQRSYGELSQERKDFRDSLQPLIRQPEQTDQEVYLEANRPEEEDKISPLNEYINKLLEVQEAEHQTAQATNQRAQQMTLAGEVAAAMGSAMLFASEQGASGFKDLARAALSAAGKIIKAKIAEGVAAVVSDAMKKFGLAGLGIGPIAGAAAAAIFGSLLGKIKVPALAKGGLARGETLAMVGDNPAASVNPEVISPLNELLGYITGAVNAALGSFKKKDSAGLGMQLSTAVNSATGTPDANAVEMQTKAVKVSSEIKLEVMGSWELTGDKLALLLNRNKAKRYRTT